MQNAYFRWKSGVLSDEQFEGIRTGNARILQSPGGEKWWRTWQDHFSKPFRDFVSQERNQSRAFPSEAPWRAV
jgi:hypothetical protein